MPEAEITDSMTLARGAPVGFNSSAAFSLTRLASLSAGTVTLTDSTLAVKGTAATSQSYDDARTAFSGPLPAALSLGNVDVLPARADPFVFSATVDEKGVTLVGYAPNDVVHKTLLATAKATFAGADITDTVTIASGEPPGFAEAAGFAIAVLDRLHDGGVTLDGLNLDVAGTAKSIDDYDALLASLTTRLPPGMKLVSAAIAPAVATAYGWQGQKANGSVILSGYVPSSEDREDIASTARTLFAGLTVNDNMRVAAGEPRMDWIGAIKFALGQLAQLGQGKVEIGDHEYSINGEALTAATYNQVLDTNGKTLPASLKLAASEVTPPKVSPFRFTVERTGTGITMSGYVPDQAARKELFDAAQRKFGNVSIGGDLVFAYGAPDGFSDAAAAGLQALSRLAGGRVDVVDKNIAVQGLTYQPQAVGDLADALNDALPDGFAADTQGVASRQDDQPVTAAECKDMLQAVLKTGQITFEGTRADISTDSVGELDRIAATMARCPDTSVEVGAHSDSDGSASRNRDRTQARAEAILDFLVSAGVKRERLTAVGYGEKNPIADNATAAGKATNRRIEFTVAAPAGG
jgi:OOP family OmpA-OmpF porin